MKLIIFLGGAVFGGVWILGYGQKGLVGILIFFGAVIFSEVFRKLEEAFRDDK
jgi:uncharacterized membrane protein YoaK (UPF0700 family)